MAGDLGVAEVEQGRADQAGQYEHLEQRVLGEGADRAVGQRVQDELGGRGQLAAAGLLVDGGGVELRRVDVHPGSGTGEVSGQQTEDERDRGGHLEPDQGLDPDAAEGLEVTRLRDLRRRPRRRRAGRSSP